MSRVLVGAHLLLARALMNRRLFPSQGRSFLVAAVLLASCQGDRSTPSAPQLTTNVPVSLISDGAHSNGTPGFFFLPPMVANPHESGPFDYDIATINPVISICDVTTGPDVTCGSSAPGSTPAIRSFTMTTDPAISVDFEKYKVNWDTGDDDFVAGRVYRVHVFAGPARRELGFADVFLTRTPGQVKNHDNQIIVLKDGRTLPIHFRIEEGVVPRVGPAKSFQLTGLPGSLASGAIVSLTVTARDVNGNVASGYRGTVVFTSSDPSATLPSAYTFTEGDAGTHTFTNAISLIRAGAATVRLTDDADESIFGEASITVLPLAAAKLEVTGLNNPSEAGAVNSITVTARDANDNVATGYTGTITFTSNDPQATLPENYTFTAEDAGTRVFTASVTLRTAGAATVRAADNADANIFGEASITVLPRDAATLHVAGLNDPFEAGTVGSITVTARDANGNVATGYTGTIAFTSSDPQATLPQTYTFTAEDAGTHAFASSVTLRTAGSITVTATDEATNTITGGKTVTVTPAAASTLVLSGVPTQSTAGVAYDLTVTAKDQFGNTATGYGGTVQFSASDAAATVPAAYAFQAGDAGVRPFPGGVTFKTAGSQTLQATDAAAPSIADNLATTVIAAAAAQLRFTTQPSNALKDEVIAPPVVVTAYDAFGNQATTFTGLVSVGVAGATLFGDFEKPAVQGVATFNTLAIGNVGTGFRMVATSAELSATSDPFDIIAPVPVEVHWTNPSGGNWSVASNWSTGTVPTAEQTALIDLPGTYTVTLDANVTVGSLSLGATSGIQSLNIPSGRILSTLTSTNVLATGRVTVNGSTINGPGTLAIASGAMLTLNGGTINAPLVNAGTIAETGNSALNGSVSTVAGSLIRVSSVGFGGSALTIANAFTNNGVIELTGTTANGVQLTVNGTLVNAAGGTISILAGVGGGRTISAPINNQGTLTVGAALLLNRPSTEYLNSGLITLTGGNLTVNLSGARSFTNTGTVTIPGGRTLTIAGFAPNGGSFTHAAGATLDGDGALSLGGSINPAAFNAPFTLGALNLTSTVANFTTDITTQTLALTLSGSTINGPGTVTNAANRTLTLNSSTINAPLVNAGTVVGTGSGTLNGSVTTVPGSIIRVLSVGFGGSALTVNNGFTNNGIIELTGTTANGVQLTVNGTLVNAASGTISILPGAGGSRTISAAITNQGTLAVGAPLLVDRANTDFLNSGLVALTGGNLTVSLSGAKSFTNTGTVTIPTGRTLTIGGFAPNGGSFRHASGATLDGGGGLSFSGLNPAAFEAPFTLGALTLQSTTASFATAVSTANMGLALDFSTINGPGTLTNAAGKTLSITGSTINAPFVNEGTFVAVGGTSSVNGGFTTAAGSVQRVLSVGFGGSGLNVASGFTNNGTIEITATVANGAALTVNGTLVNAPGATIAVHGVAGGRSLNAQLDNQGTLNTALPLFINRTSADHTNSGTITVTGGEITISQGGITPSFTNSGVIDLTATTTALRIGSGAVTNAAAASIKGQGVFEAGGSAPFQNAGNVTVRVARIGNSVTSTGSFAPTTAEFFGSATSIPVGTGYSYTNVSVLSNASFGGSVSFPGNMTVGAGNLTIGAHEISVGGLFATQNTAVLTMQNAAGVLAVGGNVTFGGGGTNTRLTAGTLRVGGNFAQAGIASAFAPSGTHLTVLNGSGAQSVSFANPGTASTLSHFQRLEIENASTAGVTINSAVFANGQLRTASSAAARTIRSSSGQTLQAGGLDAVGLVMDATPLRIVNGDLLTRFDDGVFRNMDPAVTQFRLDRLDGAPTFNNIRFEITPTSGAYMHLVDTNLAAPLFTVTMQGTQPANHGGKIIESVAGQLIGWPF